MWQTVKLDEVCVKITDGSHNPPKGIESSNYLMLSSKNVFDDQINFEKPRYLSEDDFAKENKRTNVQQGDVLLTIVGTIGRCAVVGDLSQPFTLQRSVAVLKPKRGLVDSRFLMFALRGMLHELESGARGVAQKGIYLKSLQQLSISLPPLAEQQRIVAKLDAAFAEIDRAVEADKSSLVELDALRERVVAVEMLKHENEDSTITKLLSEVCDLQNGYAFKSQDYVESSNTLNIRMSNIRPNGNFDPSHNARFLPDSYAKEYSQFLLNEGDLIIAMTDMAGDPKILGVPTLVAGLQGRNFLLNQRVGRLWKFSKDVYVPFLSRFLTTLKSYYKSKGAGGLQINISKKEILAARIHLPPYEEQIQVVERVDEVLALCAEAALVVDRKLHALAKLKSAILAQELQPPQSEVA